jgi:hypothetical protein
MMEKGQDNIELYTATPEKNLLTCEKIKSKITNKKRDRFF